MATMVRPTIEQMADERVLELIRERGAISAADLIDLAYKTFSLDSSNVRRALWRLIAQHEVQMTPDQELTPVQQRKIAG